MASPQCGEGLFVFGTVFEICIEEKTKEHTMGKLSPNASKTWPEACGLPSFGWRKMYFAAKAGCRGKPEAQHKIFDVVTFFGLGLLGRASERPLSRKIPGEGLGFNKQEDFFIPSF